MYLIEKVGFGREELHEIAEELEHIELPIFFQRIEELTGFPRVDSHGSPIPYKGGKIEIQTNKSLNECPPASEVVLKVLGEPSNEFL